MFFDKFKKIFHIILGLLIFFVPNITFAQSQSSNYQLYGGQITPIIGSLSSSNYAIDQGGAVVGGRSTSNAYTANQGAPVGTALVATTDTPTTQTSSAAGAGGRTNVVEAEVEDISVTNIIPGEVVVTFDTDIQAVTYIRYGQNGLYTFVTPEEESFFRRHSFVLPNINFT